MLNDGKGKYTTLNLNTIFIIIAIIGIIFGAGKSYGVLTTLQVKIDDIEESLESYKNDYARKDVIGTRFDSIDKSLTELKSDVRAIRDDK